MKKIFVISILLVVVVSLMGCKKETYDYKLKIKESSWSGWSEDYKPEEKTNEYEVTLDKEYVIDSNLKFTIKKVEKDHIVIETTDAFSNSENGIDLDTNKKEFTVTFDKELKLTTPTMDAGYTYYLVLVK